MANVLRFAKISTRSVDNEIYKIDLYTRRLAFTNTYLTGMTHGGDFHQSDVCYSDSDESDEVDLEAERECMLSIINNPDKSQFVRELYQEMYDGMFT